MAWQLTDPFAPRIDNEYAFEVCEDRMLRLAGENGLGGRYLLSV